MPIQRFSRAKILTQVQGKDELSLFFAQLFFQLPNFYLFLQLISSRTSNIFIFIARMKNEIFPAKRNRNKKLYHRRNIKTQTQDVNLIHQASRMNQQAHQRCQSFLQAVNNICVNSKSKPHVLNISIPLSLNNSTKSKGESFQARMNKFKQYFIAKLRRKQQARSKILLQRMEHEGRSVSLIQLSQKWLQSSKPPQIQKDRAQAIKQMKLKVRKRNQFSFSQSKIKPQNHHYISRVCNLNLI